MSGGDEGVELYIERWGLVFEADGMPRIAGRIWGWLLVCDPPMQAPQELEAALGVSKGSISTNTRLLEQAGLIERVAVPGSRRTHFRIRADAFEELMRRKQDSIRTWRDLAERGLELDLEGSTDRLEAAAEFYRFIEAEQREIMERWDAREAGDVGEAGE